MAELGKKPGLGEGGQKGTKTVSVPFPDSNSMDDILAIMRDAMMRGGVQKITVENGKSIDIEYETEERSQEATSEGAILLADIIRNTELEVISGNFPSPLILIAQVLQSISNESLHACFIVTRLSKNVCRWYSGGQREHLDNIMGMSIHESPDIPEDVAVICAAPTKIATPLDVAKCYKITLDEPVEEKK